MKTRALTLIGMALGAVWALGVLAAPGAMSPGMFLPINVALYISFLPGGVVLALMIGWIAARRFFDGDVIDGQTPPPGSRLDIDRRVTLNTVEQLVLAFATWPIVALVHSGVTVVVMGAAFAVARILFWVGYHISPPLRAFGFAATFYPTLFALAWSALVWRS